MQSVFPVLDPASPHAKAVYDLFLQVLAVSTFIFTLVTVLIVLTVWRGRKVEATLTAEQFGNHRIEMSWMIGPLLVVIWLAVASASLIFLILAAPQTALVADSKSTSEADLIVTGRQWWWEVRYPSESLTSANEIHIPIAKKMLVLLESADVVHSFWIPRLGGKMDCVPGRQNQFWLEATTAGRYEGVCAEFCGNQHAWMKFTVFAHSPEDYAAWLQAEKSSRQKPTSGDAQEGERLFFTSTCANCHAVEGTAAKAKIGPDLTQLSLRKHLGAGVMENSEENLFKWLKNPQAIKPGCNMPNFKLSDQAARQIAAYLEAKP